MRKENIAKEKTIHARIQETSRADAGILDAFGIEVVHAFEGECELHCRVPKVMVNAAGFAHGNVAFTLLDTACAYALGSLEVQGVTINANTTYTKGASTGDVLRAHCTVISRTKRTASLRGEVLVGSGEGTEIAAHGTFVFALIAPRD